MSYNSRQDLLKTITLLYLAWSGWERIVDVVPGGTELEPQIKCERLARCSHS